MRTIIILFFAKLPRLLNRPDASWNWTKFPKERTQILLLSWKTQRSRERESSLHSGPTQKADWERDKLWKKWENQRPEIWRGDMKERKRRWGKASVSAISDCKHDKKQVFFSYRTNGETERETDREIKKNRLLYLCTQTHFYRVARARTENRYIYVFKFGPK